MIQFIFLIYTLGITYIIVNTIEKKDAQVEISLTRSFIFGVAYNKEFAPKEVTEEDTDLFITSFQVCFGPLVVTLTTIEEADEQ